MVRRWAAYYVDQNRRNHNAHTARGARMSREKRDLHALNPDGMVLCNPRDREAAHRAEMEGIATDDTAAVTCRKCLDLLYRLTER